MTLTAVDHLVWAAPDLERAAHAIADLLGVEPAPGGAHPAWGTRNRLLSLGPSTYLEVIGPDPDADPGPEAAPDPGGGPRRAAGPGGPELFGIAGLTGPRLVTWAAKATDLETLRARATEAGIALGPVLDGSRRTPEGVALRWRLTDPLAVVWDGLVPFFIDWRDTPHPAASAPPAGSLVALAAEHPEGDAVGRALAWLGLEGVPVRPGPAPRLVARIETARGVVELR